MLPNYNPLVHTHIDSTTIADYLVMRNNPPTTVLGRLTPGPFDDLTGILGLPGSTTVFEGPHLPVVDLALRVILHATRAGIATLIIARSMDVCQRLLTVDLAIPELGEVRPQLSPQATEEVTAKAAGYQDLPLSVITTEGMNLNTVVERAEAWCRNPAGNSERLIVVTDAHDLIVSAEDWMAIVRLALGTKSSLLACVGPGEAENVPRLVNTVVTITPVDESYDVVVKRSWLLSAAHLGAFDHDKRSGRWLVRDES